MDIFDAIVQIESGGDCKAVNFREMALGPAQIRSCYLADANAQLRREGRKSYGREDCFDLDCSRSICEAYWRRYGAKTDEEKARIHNGGPSGMKKKATEAYWQKVQLCLMKSDGE